MSAAAPANAQIQQPAPLPMPTTQEELRSIIAQELSRLLSIPENIQALAASMASASAAALNTVNVVNQRMEAHPQLVRTEYPNCAKVTIVETDAVGELDVKMEERDKETNEWIPLQRPDHVLGGIRKLVLSQVTFAGDVWFVTTTAEVNRFQDQMVNEQFSMLESN